MTTTEQGVNTEARALYDAGFRGNDLLNMIAVSLAESSARLSDLSAQPGSGGIGTAGEVGPLQIHPVHFGNIPREQANTYEGSAQYAGQLVYHTPQGFKHWSVFNDGTYRKYQQAAGEAMRSLPADSTATVSKVPNVAPDFGGGARSASARDEVDIRPESAGPANAKLHETLDTIGTWSKIPWGRAAVTVAAVMLIVMGTGIYAFAPAIEHGAKTAAKGLVVA